MEQGVIIELASSAMMTIIQVSGPLLLLGLVVGLAISVFQATTQIQEQSLAFVPKLIAILGGVVLFGPWMLTVIREFTINLFNNINTYIK